MSQFKRQLSMISQSIKDTGQEIHKEETLHLFRKQNHMAIHLVIFVFTGDDITLKLTGTPKKDLSAERIEFSSSTCVLWD